MNEFIIHSAMALWVSRDKVRDARVVDVRGRGVSGFAVIEACFELSRMEGIIPALESAHAPGALIKMAKTMPKTGRLLVNMSGRGDKDLCEVVSV